MSIDLVEVGLDKYELIQRLYVAYMEDMSQFFTAKRDAHGNIEYNDRQILKYWEEEDHWPYILLSNGEACGFCLLRKYPDEKHSYDIEQYYVRKSHRKTGVGRLAFHRLLRKHAGDWQIRVLPRNKPAIEFWRGAIESYLTKEITPVKIDEHGETMFVFNFATKT